MLKKIFTFKITKDRIISFLIIFFGGLMLIGLDQWTKDLAVNNPEALQKAFNVPLIKKLFYYSLTYNTGAFSGIFSGNKFLLVSLSLVGSLVILFLGFRFGDFKNNALLSVCIMLLFGGTYGNFIDRAFFENGVVDFIRFTFWPSFNTFNLADSFLTIGAIILMIYIVFFYHEEPKEKEENIEEDPNAKN